MMCALLLVFAAARAQCPPANIPLNVGESVNYDLYFKWGVIMSRAGEATISYNTTKFRGATARRYRMLFRTIKIFESVYRMRDTLDCYYTSEGALLYSVKRSNENDYRLTDELTFYYPAKSRTTIRSRRYTPTEMKIDTTLYVRSGCAFDMLGATYFLRTINRTSLKAGDVFPAVIAVGHDLVKVNLRYPRRCGARQSALSHAPLLDRHPRRRFHADAFGCGAVGGRRRELSADQDPREAEDRLRRGLLPQRRPPQGAHELLSESGKVNSPSCQSCLEVG